MHLIQVAEHLGVNSLRPRHLGLNVQMDGGRKMLHFCSERAHPTSHAAKLSVDRRAACLHCQTKLRPETTSRRNCVKSPRLRKPRHERESIVEPSKALNTSTCTNWRRKHAGSHLPDHVQQPSPTRPAALHNPIQERRCAVEASCQHTEDLRKHQTYSPTCPNNVATFTTSRLGAALMKPAANTQ